MENSIAGQTMAIVLVFGGVKFFKLETVTVSSSASPSRDTVQATR
jgi:hypothetical protein